MGSDHAAMAGALLRATRDERGFEAIARLVARRGLHDDPLGVVLDPRGGVAGLQLLPAVRDLGVVSRHRLDEAVEQRRAVAGELSSHHDHDLVHAGYKVVGRLIAQKAVFSFEGLLIVGADAVVAGGKLGAEDVEGIAARRRGAAREFEVVRREGDRRHDAAQISRALGFAVEQALLLPIHHLQRELQIAGTVGRPGVEPGERRAVAHHLRGGRIAERRLRGEQLDALYDVGLARRIGSDEHGQPAQSPQFEMGIVPEIDELEALKRQSHRPVMPVSYAMRTGMTR